MPKTVPAAQDNAAEPRHFSGRRVRQLREERGLSREALAVAIRRSYGSVRMYEGGEVVPPGRVLGRLAAALGVEVSDLFEVEDA